MKQEKKLIRLQWWALIACLVCWALGATIEAQRNRRLYISATTPKVEESAKPIVEEIKEEAPKMRSLGTFKITNYDGCYECNGVWTGYPTKSGTDYVEGRTVGVDENIIPLGSKIVIDGHEYIAEDTGAFSGNVIDVYVSDHSKFNMYYTEVFVYMTKDELAYVKANESRLVKQHQQEIEECQQAVTNYQRELERLDSCLRSNRKELQEAIEAQRSHISSIEKENRELKSQIALLQSGLCGEEKQYYSQEED